MSRKRAGRDARKAFEQKVRLLERCARCGVDPDPSRKLRALKDVQQWRGRRGRYGTWSSFTVAAPGGPNADLRARLDKVLPRIEAIQLGERLSTTNKPRRGQAVTNAQLNKEVERLSKQCEDLFEQLRDEKASHVRTRQSLETAERQIAELKARLAKVQPLRSIP